MSVMGAAARSSGPSRTMQRYVACWPASGCCGWVHAVEALLDDVAAGAMPMTSPGSRGGGGRARVTWRGREDAFAGRARADQSDERGAAN